MDDVLISHNNIVCVDLFHSGSLKYVISAASNTKYDTNTSLRREYVGVVMCCILCRHTGMAGLDNAV